MEYKLADEKTVEEFNKKFKALKKKMNCETHIEVSFDDEGKLVKGLKLYQKVEEKVEK